MPPPKIAVFAPIPSASVHDGCRREAWILTQHTERVGQIRAQRLDGWEHLHVPPVFLYQCGVAELPPRCEHGGFRRHALPPIALRQQSDVFLDLVLKLEVALFIANRATDPRPQFPQPTDHDFSLANRSTRPITPEIRSQSSVSFASCFRPLFVIE